MAANIVAVRIARKQWDATPALRAPRDYQIDESVVRIAAGAAFSAPLDRHFFRDARFTQGCFILRTKTGPFHFFPAAVVRDPAALRALIARHVLLKG